MHMVLLFIYISIYTYYDFDIKTLQYSIHYSKKLRAKFFFFNKLTKQIHGTNQKNTVFVPNF